MNQTAVQIRIRFQFVEMKIETNRHNKHVGLIEIQLQVRDISFKSENMNNYIN
jgi:hypothetical protein